MTKNELYSFLIPISSRCRWDESSAFSIDNSILLRAKIMISLWAVWMSVSIKCWACVNDGHFWFHFTVVWLLNYFFFFSLIRPAYQSVFCYSTLGVFLNYDETKRKLFLLPKYTFKPLSLTIVFQCLAFSFFAPYDQNLCSNEAHFGTFHVRWSATVTWAAGDGKVSCFEFTLTITKQRHSKWFSFSYSIKRHTFRHFIFSLNRFHDRCATWARA